ncbi:hypothetical protein [Clostridium sp.]|uniref:hypothetical protein n=1 Tax=Clostridium sp. TaxID=1506 RepID=UPI00359FC025
MATGYESISVSFSKKNLDVWNILTKKKKDITFNQNDYICNAIRFYEKNKDKMNKIITKEEIEKIIDERFSKLLLDNDLDISKKDINTNIGLEHIPENINFEDD